MKIRDPHKQICPWLAKDERTVVLIISSKSQSAKMIFGFFPPSSRDNFLNIGPAVRAMYSPVFVPPVKEIALIFGCLTIASPACCPKPCTIFRTPAGIPLSRTTSLSK
ncbi:hypothetical protein D3C86_1729790 [compost metagenome]